MRDPRLYTRSLIACQSSISIVYITIGVLVYYYCGSYVTSPAPGSAGPLVKKVAYGIGIPGLLASALLTVHVSLPVWIVVRHLLIKDRQSCLANSSSFVRYEALDILRPILLFIGLAGSDAQAESHW